MGFQFNDLLIDQSRDDELVFFQYRLTPFGYKYDVVSAEVLRVCGGFEMRFHNDDGLKWGPLEWGSDLMK